MADRVALVTGASRGIGLAIAARLARDGWAIAMTARDDARLQAAAGRLRGNSAAVLAVPGDLRDPAAPARIVAEAVARLGAIDLLVNNAGTAPSNKIERTTDAELDEVLDLHVKAPFRLVQAVVPGMRQRGRGCLIQMASTAGLRGYPLIAAYAAAKHGMVGLTRALAAELHGTPIRVFAVCPGFVDTDITRAAAAKIAQLGKRSEAEVLRSYAAMNVCGRLIAADEVAEQVAWLADPSCAAPSGSLRVLDAMPPASVS